MNKRPAKPTPMSWIVPYLTVADVGKAVDFYHQVFGFEILSTAADESGNMFHAELKYKDIVIMCGQAGMCGSKAQTPCQGNYQPPITLYLYCEAVDEFYKKVKQSVAKIIAEPADQFWGDRIFQVTDLDGYAWSFATNVADHQ
ncbi:MAG: hypothetical protein A3E87_03065 [Gammaproteobacteria bacterium RIFCSPHIGHO2_12_FULL_35_23]|nr:MAG: hypothetical protein A3E87_03065 [Gammaproteobacteria bacterium RIFCSPHIGHO2_12_FULL_35_23]